MFIAALFINSQVMESALMDKDNVVHIHNGVLFNHKEQNYVICRKMDGTGYHHVK
jgi:hypothetical protein